MVYNVYVERNALLRFFFRVEPRVYRVEECDCSRYTICCGLKYVGTRCHVHDSVLEAFARGQFVEALPTARVVVK